MQLNDPKLSLALAPTYIMAAISPRAPITRTPHTPCN